MQPAAPIGLNFKDTPLDQVLPPREAGLPVTSRCRARRGRRPLLSAQTYTFDEALSILNLNLLSRGVQLRKQDKYLYLSTLADSAGRSRGRC